MRVSGIKVFTAPFNGGNQPRRELAHKAEHLAMQGTVLVRCRGTSGVEPSRGDLAKPPRHELVMTVLTQVNQHQGSQLYTSFGAGVMTASERNVPEAMLAAVLTANKGQAVKGVFTARMEFEGRRIHWPPPTRSRLAAKAARSVALSAPRISAI
ncbi:hypothetical protein D3C85_1400250 [compost metagenome]